MTPHIQKILEATPKGEEEEDVKEVDVEKRKEEEKVQRKEEKVEEKVQRKEEEDVAN